MNVEKKHAERDEIRQRAAAEVIELGEMLFDAALDAAMRRPAEGEEIDALSDRGDACRGRGLLSQPCGFYW